MFYFYLFIYLSKQKSIQIELIGIAQLWYEIYLVNFPWVFVAFIEICETTAVFKIFKNITQNEVKIIFFLIVLIVHR